jgi:tetratricopeptide (TPR) repeat protein
MIGALLFSDYGEGYSVRKDLFVAAALGLAGLPQSANAEWVEASSDHFLVYGDISEQDARDYAERLERVDRLLRTITKAPDTAAERANRVTVYVVPDMETVERLYGGEGVGGFYRAHAQGSIAVTPRSMKRLSQYMRPQEVLFHEYTHAILIGSSPVPYPKWLQEGFAEFFGTIEAKDNGNLIVGGLPLIRGFALAEQNQISAEELLTADQHKLNDVDTSHLYARGWLLVHMLMLKKERDGQLDKYMQLVASGVPSLSAGKQAFGDLDRLDRDLKVYLRSSKFQSLEIPADKVSGGRASVRTLRPCEAKIMPTRIRSAVGVNPKTASDVAADARRAAAGCDSDPFVQRTLAETEFDAKNDQASMTAADRALAADSNNIMAMVYKGRVYARAKNWAEARRWFIRANRAEPNYALPLVLYFDSYVRAGQAPTPSATNGLLRALVLVPNDPTVRIRVVRAMVNSGDLATAKVALAPLAYGTHGNPDAVPSKILGLIEAGKDKNAILAEMDKAKWNEIGNE